MAIIQDVEGLDPKEVVDVQREARFQSESLPGSRKLSVALQGFGSAINVFYGNTASHSMGITLQRTIRVPDNDDTSKLPPSLGAFPLFRIRDYAEKLPPEMATKGGLFFPMYQREAMWIQFQATIPFALKMYVGGVNAVSGFPMAENEKTKEKRLKMLAEKKDLQDYMVLPNQPWLDGIVSEDGNIRQFVAKPKGSGFSVEAQVTGEEKIGGIQFEIIPMRKEFPRTFKVKCFDGGEARELEINLEANDITETSTWADVEAVIAREMGKSARLSSFTDNWTKIQFGGSAKLGDSIFHPGFILRADIGATFGQPFGGMSSQSLCGEPDFSSIFDDGCNFQFEMASAPSTSSNPFGGGPSAGDFLFDTPPLFDATSLFEACSPPSGANGSPSGSTLDCCCAGSIPPKLEGSNDGGLCHGYDRAPNSSSAAMAVPLSVHSDVFHAASSFEPRAKLASKGSAPTRKKVKEMGIAAGGFIKQTIRPDTFPASMWDRAASVLLNVQILDSEDFCEVTGQPPPKTPVDAMTYASHGYPFFDIWGEENTGIKGEFNEVKSVAQIEAERAAARGETVKPEDSVDARVVGLDMPYFKSTFHPLEEMRRELEEMSLAK